MTLSVNHIPLKTAKAAAASRSVNVIFNPYCNPMNGIAAKVPTSMKTVNIMQVDITIFFMNPVISEPFSLVSRKLESVRSKPDAPLNGRRELPGCDNMLAVVKCKLEARIKIGADPRNMCEIDDHLPCCADELGI